MNGRPLAADSLMGALVPGGSGAARVLTTLGDSCPSDCEPKDQVLIVPLLGETEKMTLVK